MGRVVATFTVVEYPDGFEVAAERSEELEEATLVDVMRQYLDDLEGAHSPGWGKP